MACKMFVLLLLVVESSFTLKINCAEYRNISLLDCSRQQLSLIPCFGRSITWVKSIDLKWNNITNVNFSCVSASLPNLDFVDLRHNPFTCTKTKLFKELNIKVRSDCSYTTVKPTSSSSSNYSPTNIISTTPQFFVYTLAKTTSTVTFSFVNISTPNSNKNGQTTKIIMATLFPAGVLIACVLGVLACFCIRRKRRHPVSEFDLIPMSSIRHLSETSLSTLSSDSEVNLYTKVTAV